MWNEIIAWRSPRLCTHTPLYCYFRRRSRAGKSKRASSWLRTRRARTSACCLGAVKPVKSGPPDERQQSPPKTWVSKMFFQGQDVVKIVARDVDLRGTKAEASNSKAATAFGTDADISRGRREECVCSTVIILGMRVHL